MQEPVLTPLANLANQTSAVNTINANSVTTATALTNTLDRYGSSPNQMQSVLDMNNYNVINLPAPATINSPARLIDVVSNPTIQVPTVGTSGSTVPLLNGINTWSGTQNFTGATVNLPTSFSMSSLTLNGATSGSTILQPSAIATGTLTLPATTDTLQGAATTATFTNKTYDTGGTGNSFLINGNAITSVTGTGAVVLATNAALTTPTITNQVGSNGTSSAAAGAVGEYMQSVIALGSAVAFLGSATPTNLTSITLSAGDWDLNGVINVVAGATTTTLEGLIASYSTTTGGVTFDYTNGRAIAPAIGATGAATFTMSAAAAPAGQVSYSMPTVRFLVTSPTVVYIVCQVTYTSTAPTMYGLLRARRTR